jgi:hypothetical protein
MNPLPVFEGWTVDVHLREFRRAEVGQVPEFIPFASPRGQELLNRWEDSQKTATMPGPDVGLRDPARKTYANPDAGNTYYLAPRVAGGEEVLWACPTLVDGSADFASAIAETDFADPLSVAMRARILDALRAEATAYPRDGRKHGVRVSCPS